MIPVDGHDLYLLGKALQPLHNLRPDDTIVEFWLETVPIKFHMMGSRAAWGDRDRDGAMQAISDDMVREIEVIGPIDSVGEQLAERSASGAELQMVQMPGGSAAEAGARLEALLRVG